MAINSKTIVQPFLRAGEGLVNAYLAQDPATAAKLTPLAGKIIAIEITDFQLQLQIVLHASQCQLRLDNTHPYDARVAGTAISFGRLLLQENKTVAVKALNIQVEGDTELVTAFNSVLSQINIDWEEYIAHYFGDIIAHQMGFMQRKLKSLSKLRRRHLQKNLSEYLQEELQCLPASLQVSDWYDAIDTLRDDVERLEARLLRLQSLVNNY